MKSLSPTVPADTLPGAPASLLPGPLFLPPSTGSVCTWLRQQSPGRPAPASHPGWRWKWHFPCWDGTRQAASLWAGRSHPGSKGATSPGSCSEASACALRLLRSSSLQPQRGGRLPWHLSPCHLLSLESHRPVPRQPEAATCHGRWKGNPKSWGPWLVGVRPLNPRGQPLCAPGSPVPPSGRRHSSPAASAHLTGPSRAQGFPRACSGVQGTGDGGVQNRVRQVWAQIPAATLGRSCH